MHLSHQRTAPSERALLNFAVAPRSHAYLSQDPERLLIRWIRSGNWRYETAAKRPKQKQAAPNVGAACFLFAELN